MEEERNQSKSRGLGRLFAGVLSLCVTAAFSAGLTPEASAKGSGLVQDEEEAPQQYGFHLYNTAVAKGRAEEASGHMAAGRWSEALGELQALIEEHRGEVLAASRPRPEDARLPSQADVHPGAGMWALDQLFRMPVEAKELYRARFGPRAADALRRAVAAGDRGALAKVAQRWPITRAAQRAWWALGDLEVELGNTADGLRAWARAATQELASPTGTVISKAEWQGLRTQVAETLTGATREGVLNRLDLALELLESTGASRGTQKESEASFVSGPATGIAAQELIVRDPFTTGGKLDEEPAGWDSALLLPPGPFRQASDAGRLFPAKLGDALLVNTSRSVHAIDAFDGTEIWSFNASELGWDRLSPSRITELSQAVDTQEHMVSVAASRGVVVAPVQIPWLYQESATYNQLKIIEPIPERRLVALDAETGEVLWNTLPPVGWDGDSGSFADRMTVVGPPTIVGARVLVPMAKLRGRIELHLGCFDLASGEVLWSSPLVTGQRTLNMFGRANIEFSAPPPVVVGDTAIVLTQLGIVAAVDLFTGETRWNTIYEQVTINAPQYFTEGSIENIWHNAPPVVSGSTVLAAPFDGDALIALDIDSGAMLWSIDQRRLSENMGVPVRFRGRSRRVPRLPGLNLLLGADEKHVLLAGQRIASVEFPAGVRSGPPYHAAWVWPIESDHSLSSGVPVLDKNQVFVPYGPGIATVERSTGRVVENVPGRIGTGNLLVADGMLFSASGVRVDARFQWRAMVERARTAVGAEDATLADAVPLIRLLLERAATSIERGANVVESLQLLDEAQAVLEGRFGIGAPGVRGGTGGDDPSDRLAAGAPNGLAGGPAGGELLDTLREELCRSYILRGKAERLRGDGDAARSAVRRSLGLVTSTAQERGAYLTLHEIERARDPAARLLITKELKGPTHRSARLGVRAELSGRNWSASAVLNELLQSVRTSRAGDVGAAAALWRDPFKGPIIPVAGSAGSASDSGTALSEAVISCGLFALISEIEVARGRTQTLAPDRDRPSIEPALSEELVPLHAILRDYPDENLFGVSSGLWATARIQALRSLYPSSKAFAPFEAEANALLAQAVASVSREKGQGDLLESIPTLYPGSEAATRAADVRVEVALTSGTPAEVAAIVVASLKADWHPARTTRRQAELLLELGATLGTSGNLAFKSGLASNLARFSPELVVTAPDEKEMTLAEVAQEFEAELTGSTMGAQGNSTPSFTNAAVERTQLTGDFIKVDEGSLLKGDGTTAKGSDQPVGFFASRGELVAIPSGARGEPIWRRPESLGLSQAVRPDRVTLVDGRWLVVARERELVCLDARTGEERWTFEERGRNVARVKVGGGMVVVVTVDARNHNGADVHGLDVSEGVELWRLGQIGRSYHQDLKIDSGRLVMLPAGQTRAAVHDLYTGHPVVAIQTGKIQNRMALAAWADRGHLVIPHMEGARNDDLPNAIVAYNLDDGQEAWRVDLDSHGGSTMDLLGLVELPAKAGSDEVVRIALLERVEAGSRASTLTLPALGLYVLNERLGALDQRPLAELEKGARLVGVQVRRREVLESPILVAMVESRSAANTTIRAIDPGLGRIWEVTSFKHLRTSAARNLPAPLVGDGVLAMMVSERFGDRSRQAAETKLMFLDASSGSLLEIRRLKTAKDQNRWQMSAFGSTLSVGTQRNMEILE